MPHSSFRQAAGPVRVRRATGLFLGLILWFAGATASHGQDLGRMSERELEARVEALFGRSCAQAGCHAAPFPQQDMDLSAEHYYASVVGVPSKEQPEVLRVKPGDPENSYLIRKVKGDPSITGTQMPLIGEKLTPEEIGLLEAWVRSIEAVDEARVEAAPPPEPLPFAGWRVVNVPTTRTVPAGSVLFGIRHRFNPPLSSGYDSFYGLDGSGIILLSLGYAFTDDLFVTLGRSNAADDVELQGKYRPAKQGAWPFDAAVLTTLNWISKDVPGEGRFTSAAFKFTGQVVLAREVAPGIGLAVAPGVTVNPSHESNADDVLVTLGLAGRWRFHGNLSLIGEWTPILTGYTRTRTFGNENRFDSWGGGLEIATGGHIFQIVVSNSVGIATDQYLNGGDLDVRDGDMRLGFNIYRILNF
jgi:mono/diheme cytochrome c family protein